MKTKVKIHDKMDLRILEKAAGHKLESLLETLGVEGLSRRSRFYVGKCPIHGDADNGTAFNIFHTGHETIGNWRCFTHSCHKHFQPNIIGFVRGYISRNKYGWTDPKDVDKECSFADAISFLMKFVGGQDLSEIKIDYQQIEQGRFVNSMTSTYAREEPARNLNISRRTVRDGLSIPAEYYVSRHYTAEILEKYDVGLCTEMGKQMFMRAVVPIYDDDHKNVVGCSGRAIFDMCPICNSYHNPTHQCPDDKNKWKFCKWRHNYGFKGENYLYNYWYAKDYIRKSKVAIIVESPGNVWRLEEAGIHNSIATFGAHLTDGQRYILDKSGALALIVLTDPDHAGRLALENIRESCGSIYSIHSPVISDSDIGEATVTLLHNKLVPIINKIESGLAL